MLQCYLQPSAAVSFSKDKKLIILLKKDWFIKFKALLMDLFHRKCLLFFLRKER